MSCNNCENETHKKPETIPYIVHEAVIDRMEREFEAERASAEKREQRHIREKKYLWITIIVVVSMLFASWIGFLIYESQFVEISYHQDGEGLNNVNVGSQGDLNYGADGTNQSTTEGK